MTFNSTNQKLEIPLKTLTFIIRKKNVFRSRFCCLKSSECVGAVYWCGAIQRPVGVLSLFCR